MAQYNKRAKEQCFEIGQQVIVLLPDSTNKWLSRWQCLGCIIAVRSPHSYLVELDRGQRRMDAC